MRRSLQIPVLLRLAGLLALLILAGVILWQARRPDPATGQERSDRLAGALDRAHILEQTFTAGRDDLCAIDIFPRIPPGRLDPRYMLTLRLRESGATQDLAILQRSLVDARSQQRVSFTFPAQPNSRGKTYLLRVETDSPADTVSLLSAAEDVYPGGDLLQDHQPTGRDLAFRTYTALAPLVLVHELAQGASAYGWLVLFSLFFGAAGWALLEFMNLWPDQGIFERGLWSLGVGLAVVPVIFLLAGMQAGWVIAGLALLAVARKIISGMKTRPGINAATGKVSWEWGGWPLLVLYGWALAIRLLQVRDVPAPMWVDGLSHVQMIQTILAAGRMPSGLLYHIGFHTQVALLYKLSSLPLPRLIVLVGQMVSAFTGPALFVLVKRICSTAVSMPVQRSRHVALLAALALTCFPSLPGYLINWGRYPFLLGLTLLPFTLAASIDALRESPSLARLPRYILLVVLLAGQFLCHYGTLSFWLSFCVVFLLVDHPAWVKQVRLGHLIAGGLILLMVGLAGGYLRFGDNLIGKIASTIAESRQVSEELDYASIWQINFRAGGLWLALAGFAGGIWAALRNHRLLLFSAGWFAVQAALIALQAPLLGFALASYANLLLALPLPLAVLTGGLLGTLLERPQVNSSGSGGQKFSWLPAGSLIVVLLALAGGLSQIGILNPTTLLYGPTDVQAMDWVRANIPQDAKILINSRFWSAAQVVPADSGGWITEQARREVVYLQATTQLAQLDSFLTQRKISYVYLGRSAGFLNRSIFEKDPDHYPRIYHAGGIDIYTVRFQ